ncbi:MAG: NAD(P)/FAD-dependent oxidoreductase [Thermodesulfobacteriota bacterium]|nr:NAD(P)/FAD-dependent oxidoreductase [Thermodesulfobacteriota bacterium]
MEGTYDVIIVGGGSNGLCCGCYLAKAGLKVIIFERRHIIGGGVMTEENLSAPGFKHSLHSNFHGWIHIGPVYKDLELEKYGSKYVFPETPLAQVFSDGKCLITYTNLDRFCKEMEKFSVKDARTYRDIYNQFMSMKDIFVGYLYSPPVPQSVWSAPLEKTEFGRELLKMQMASANAVADDLYESEEIKSWVAMVTAQAGIGPDVYGTGLLVPLMTTLEHDPGWGEAIGGSGTLSIAMAGFLEAHGGKVVKNSHVERILIKDGSAIGVELADGSKIMARKLVASNVEPKQTFLKLVGEEHLDTGFIRQIKRWKYDEMSLFSFHMAIHEPPHYKASKDNPDLNKCWGVFMGNDTAATFDSQFADIRQGIQPAKDIAFCGIVPTLHDPSQAPPGKHTAFIWHYSTYNLKGGPESWKEIEEDYADRVMDVWEEFAPNMNPKNVIGRYMYTPLDIHRENISMPEGGFCSGDMTSDQMGVYRPFHGYPHYRTPIGNLYVCGPSCHPGGGCSCAPGHNAAGVIAEDLKLKKWWENK